MQLSGSIILRNLFFLQFGGRSLSSLICLPLCDLIITPDQEKFKMECYIRNGAKS